MNEPVAWIRPISLTYMKACKAQGIKDFKITLGLVPEDGDVPLYEKHLTTLNIDFLEELCLWLSHQRGMIPQDYAKELAKFICRYRELETEIKNKEIKNNE